MTKAGSSDLERPIAIRPTSETVMYPAYADASTSPSLHVWLFYRPQTEKQCIVHFCFMDDRLRDICGASTGSGITGTCCCTRTSR